MGMDRIQKVVWSDIVMGQRDSDDFTFEKAKIVGPNSIAAKSATYLVTLKRTGDAAADETVIIGGQTFTAKASPSTASGTAEFALDATVTDIAAIVQAKGLASFTITDNGDGTLEYKQTTAGTGSAVTIGAGTCTKVTASVKTLQEYAAAVSNDPVYNIEPGEPVYLVSTDKQGVKTVAPVNVTTSANITAFCGFVRNRHVIKKGETDAEVVIATNGCRLAVDFLPDVDQFGNTMKWDYTADSIRAKAESLGFKFGNSGK